MVQRDILVIKKEHIQPGIKKYQGKIDSDLKALFATAGLEVDPFEFNDGRILVLYKGQQNGILYASKQILFNKLDLS